jgi:hypothetical protein
MNLVWARRVFRINNQTFAYCGGVVNIIACIQDPAVIGRILAHLQRGPSAAHGQPPQAPRAPPPMLLPESPVESG